MLFQKLRKITAVICIIFLSQINVTGVSTSDPSVAQDYHVSYSVGFNSAKASGLKDIDNSFLKDKFIPHVVLLGLGLMSFFLIKHSESYSADTLLFIAGTSLYFVNIIMSWKSEARDFEFDKADVENNTQKSALIRQREGLEDYLDIAEKRLKFLMAATASVALATVSAGALFLSGRKSLMKLQAANKKQIVTVQSACAQSQFAFPAMLAACNNAASIASHQLKNTGKYVADVDKTIVKSIRNSEGSFSGAKDYFFSHTPMTSGYTAMGFVSKEMLAEIEKSKANEYISTPRGMVRNPKVKPYEAKPIEMNVTQSTGSSPVTYSEVDWAIERVKKAEMKRRFDSESAAQYINADGRMAKMIPTFKKSFSPTTVAPSGRNPSGGLAPVIFPNELAKPYSEYNEYNEKALFVSEVNAGKIIEKESNNMLAALAGTAIGGEAAGDDEKESDDVSSSFLIKKPSLSDDLTSMIMPSAHAFSMSGVLKPISKAAEVAFQEFDKWLFTPKGRMVVYGSVTALLGFYTAYTKKGISDIEDNIDSLNKMIDKFDENEASSASFTPKEAAPAVVAQQEFSFEALFGEMFSKIIPKAYASEAPILIGGELPIRLPCMVLDKGKCLDAKKAYSNKMPLSAQSGIPQDVQKMGSRALALTNQIQMNNKVDDKAMSLIDSLASQSDKLVALQRKYESGVNKALQSQGERAIPFEDYRKSFLNGLGKDIDQMARRMGTSTEQIAMTKFSEGPQSSFLKTKLGTKEDSGANLMDFLAEEKSSAGFEETEFDFSTDSSETASVSVKSSLQEESVNLNNGDYDEAMFSYSDIHKNKGLDIFNIISRRYELLRSRLKE